MTRMNVKLVKRDIFRYKFLNVFEKKAWKIQRPKRMWVMLLREWG